MKPPLLVNPGRAQWVSRYGPVVAQADFVGVCVLALSHHRHSVVLSESPKLDGRWSSRKSTCCGCRSVSTTEVQTYRDIYTHKTLSRHFQDTFKTLSGHFQDTFLYIHIYIYVVYNYIYINMYIYIYTSCFAMIVCTLFDGHRNCLHCVLLSPNEERNGCPWHTIGSSVCTTWAPWFGSRMAWQRTDVQWRCDFRGHIIYGKYM